MSLWQNTHRRTTVVQFTGQTATVIWDFPHCEGCCKKNTLTILFLFLLQETGARQPAPLVLLCPRVPAAEPGGGWPAAALLGAPGGPHPDGRTRRARRTRRRVPAAAAGILRALLAHQGGGLPRQAAAAAAEVGRGGLRGAALASGSRLPAASGSNNSSRPRPDPRRLRLRRGGHSVVEPCA